MTRSWLAGRPVPLGVYGPPGTARLVADLVDLYRFDVALRSAHHDPSVLQPALEPAVAHEFTLAGADESALVFDEDGLRIVAFSAGAVGDLPSVGYRFEY